MKKLFTSDNMNRTLVMGILNITPDSFSDGGVNCQKINNAVSVNCQNNVFDGSCDITIDENFILAKVAQMIKDGADIIDVGGESTRPGFVEISESAELARVVSVIKLIKKNFDVFVSLDTYKYNVAKVGLQLGVDMINDVSGLRVDERIATLVAEHDAYICLMHNDLVGDVKAFKDSEIESDGKDKELAYIEHVKMGLRESADIALAAGVQREKIVIDVGIGFGKTQEQNLLLIREIASFKNLSGNVVDKNIACIGKSIRRDVASAAQADSYPILLGVSRKSVIGRALDLTVDERDEATIALSVFARLSGVEIVRVHDVRGNARAMSMIDKVCSQG